ncbi:hypothetical protein QBC39DRAFT_346020 [Podospora conica]|nr:hypothetical protein QBC39DRAFT_346020 [Schizothecium conicum]
MQLRLVSVGHLRESQGPPRFIVSAPPSPHQVIDINPPASTQHHPIDPSTMSKGLVLVTGANGYIAAVTVEALLKAGYSVRGTVRSESSTKALAAALPQYADKLQFAIVPDIVAEGAFDEAVKGVDAVAHLASPVATHFDDPEPVLRDAIVGTLRALESANKEPSVKSFVLMSSIASVATPREDDYTYTEADWNTFAENAVKEMGKETPGFVIYAASKVAGERALWKFRDEHKPKFTVTAINPCYVTGPPLLIPESADKLGLTYDVGPLLYLGKPIDKVGIPGAFHTYVDVRDVARVVVFAIDHPDKVNNERYIVASAYAPPQAHADILRRAYPERADIIQKGTPGEGYTPGTYAFPKSKVYDGSKARGLTGQDYIPLEKTVIDTVESLKSILG